MDRALPWRVGGREDLADPAPSGAQAVAAGSGELTAVQDLADRRASPRTLDGTEGSTRVPRVNPRIQLIGVISPPPRRDMIVAA